jgi:PHP family Zn ribbon phosphoesterase
MAGVYRPRHPETKPEAERVGKYMLRPVLALERLTFLEPEGKVDPMLCPKCGGRMKVIASSRISPWSIVSSATSSSPLLRRGPRRLRSPRRSS